MRCISCDCNLSDYESTRKYPSGAYIDLCSSCLGASDIGDYIDRPDLDSGQSLLEEEGEDEEFDESSDQ